MMKSFDAIDPGDPLAQQRECPQLARLDPEGFALVRALFLSLLGALAPATGAAGSSGAPEPITAESLKWFSPPANALLRGAWVLGAESEAGLYALRVILAKGGRIPPHTHPDTRYSTILSGTLYVGFGEVVHDADMVAVPAGGVYVAPAKVPHYLWAKDGDVTYQEGGAGPTSTLPVRR